MKTKLLVIVFIQFINTIFAQNNDCSNVIKFDKAISSSNVVDFFSIQQFINQSNYEEAKKMQMLNMVLYLVGVMKNISKNYLLLLQNLKHLVILL